MCKKIAFSTVDKNAGLYCTEHLFALQNAFLITFLPKISTTANKISVKQNMHTSTVEPINC